MAEPPGQISSSPIPSLCRRYKAAIAFFLVSNVDQISQAGNRSDQHSDTRRRHHHLVDKPCRRGSIMDVRMFGLENPLFSTLQHLMSIPEEVEKAFNAPTRSYVQDAKAMASTPADVKEYPNSYAFLVDMPGIKSSEIKVQVEDDNVLVISGERKRDDDKDAKFLRMERRVGKFMRKFSLPENANTDAITAVCQDGVLTVTVEKVKPPEPKKPKTIEVKVA